MAQDFPASPVDGQVFANFTYDGAVGVWRNTPDTASGLPAGSIMAWGGATAPANWLICDGGAVSRSSYASLFSAIGVQYGVGDGSTTFNLPDLRGRVPVGKDSSQTEFDSLGETGGAKTHTLQISEMPSHTHIQDPHSHRRVTAQPGSVSGVVQIGGANTTNDYFYVEATTATNQNTGGSGAHNNLQPYQVVNYIIKTSAGITAGDSELATRVGATEALNTTQNSRLTSVEALNTTQDSRLAALETAVPSAGWTAYTPAFSNITIGNGSTAFYYQKIGKVVHVRGLIIYGSTTSFNGACDFSHPAMAATYNILHPMGIAEFYGPGLRHGRIVRINDTYSRFVCDYVSGTQVTNAELSNTYPFTWSSGYWAMLSMSYEAG